MTRDPNLSKIELIAAALGPLCGQLVFVGGCSVGLLITDAAPPVRVTFDVDLVARVSALRTRTEPDSAALREISCRPQRKSFLLPLRCRFFKFRGGALIMQC